MKKIIVYCHGFGSSAKTDKVERLKVVKDSEVYAWDIDIDPRVSIDALTKSIDDILLTDLNGLGELVFVGTSLGAWYAAVLAVMYDAKAFLINPSVDPNNSLEKYGVAEDIRMWYTPMPTPRKATVILSENDEVLDFTDVHWKLPVILVNNESGHRFNGPEFEEFVVNKI